MLRRLRELKIWITTYIDFDERTAQTSQMNRALYKWILDFIRNVMVVAALAYIAKKSDSYLIWGLALVANFVLCGYLYTYVEPWTVKSEAISKGGWNNFGALGVILLVQGAMIAISAAIFFAIDRIVSAQGLK